MSAGASGEKTTTLGPLIDFVGAVWRAGGGEASWNWRKRRGAQRCGRKGRERDELQSGERGTEPLARTAEFGRGIWGRGMGGRGIGLPRCGIFSVFIAALWSVCVAGSEMGQFTAVERQPKRNARVRGLGRIWQGNWGQGNGEDAGS